MPIYSYRCEDCGHQQDVLQKMSDPLLVTCPSCGQPAFRKQITAAGFQLKGSGWYVTDFRNPATKEPAKGAAKPDGEGAAPKGDTPAASPPPSGGDGAPPAPAPATPAKVDTASTTKSGPAPSSGRT